MQMGKVMREFRALPATVPGGMAEDPACGPAFTASDRLLRTQRMSPSSWRL
jgi:hypothetical protein